MKTIFKSVFIITLFSLVIKVLGFFMRIILSRALGAEGLGMFSVALSIFGVFTTLVSSGIPIVISHKSSKYMITGETQKEGAVVSSGLIISLTCCVAVSLILMLFKNLIINLTNNISYFVMMALLPGLFATAIYSCFRGALWGRKKHFENSLGEFFEQLVRLVLYLIMLAESPDIATGAVRAGFAISVSYIVSMIIAIIYYHKEGGVLTSPKKEIKGVVKSSAPITVIRICSSVIMSLVSVILPMRLLAVGIREDVALALYGIAVGMTMPLLSFPNTLIGSYSTALVPELSSLRAQKRNEEFNEQIKLAISITLFITFCFVPLYIGLGRAIGVMLFDNIQSGALLVKAAWIMIPSSLSGISASVLNVMNLETKSFVHYIIGFALLLFNIWFLPAVVGVESLIYGMGICMSVVSILNLLMIYKKTQIKGLVLKPLILMTIFTIPSSIISNELFGVLKYLVNDFLAVLISGTIGVVFFILLCLIFDVVDLLKLFKDFKNIKIFKFKNKKGIKHQKT